MTRKLGENQGPAAAGEADAARKSADAPPNHLVPVVALAACWTLWRIVPFLANCIATRRAPPSWVLQTDLDTVLIHRGLLQAPRFVDALRWWTGQWVLPVPFYRPLTSYVFWLEWKLFGDQESLYDLIGTGGHVLAALLFTVLVYRLAQRQRVRWPALAALVGTGGFVGFLSPYREGIIARILMWKNQPDSLAAACCFAALLCYLRAQTGDRRALAGAALWYVAACAFKEIAVPLPLVCLALEPGLLCAPERRAALVRLGAMVGAAVLFLVVRWKAIGGLGYAYGSNSAWRERTLVHLVGPFAPLVGSGEWLGNLMGIWAYLTGSWLAWQWRRPSSPAASAPIGRLRENERARLWLSLAALLLFVLGWSVMGWFSSMQTQGEGWHLPLSAAELVTGLLVCVQSLPLVVALGTVVFLLAMIAALRWCRPVVVVGLVWTVAFLAPLALSSGPTHRYYLPQAGYLLIYACAAGAGVPFLVHSLSTPSAGGPGRRAPSPDRT